VSITECSCAEKYILDCVSQVLPEFEKYILEIDNFFDKCKNVDKLEEERVRSVLSKSQKRTTTAVSGDKQ
jgi:hypothetical protein